MCNEKILGPFEENESEESKGYREKKKAYFCSHACCNADDGLLASALYDIFSAS